MLLLWNRGSFEASSMTMGLRVKATLPAMPSPMGNSCPREASEYRERLSLIPLAALISSFVPSWDGIMMEAFSAAVSSMTISSIAPATASTSGAWDIASFTRLKTVSSLLIIALPTKRSLLMILIGYVSWPSLQPFAHSFSFSGPRGSFWAPWGSARRSSRRGWDRGRACPGPSSCPTRGCA
jgi:hypothetical protein